MTALSASVFAQCHPTTPYDPSPSDPHTFISAARTWSEKAIETAAKIAPPERTRECDEGCAVATHNLGEIAEWVGDLAEARRRYEEARSLCLGIGFEEGLRRAGESLGGLEGR